MPPPTSLTLHAHVYGLLLAGKVTVSVHHRAYEAGQLLEVDEVDVRFRPTGRHVTATVTAVEVRPKARVLTLALLPKVRAASP